MKKTMFTFIEISRKRSHEHSRDWNHSFKIYKKKRKMTHKQRRPSSKQIGAEIDSIIHVVKYEYDGCFKL